VRYDRVVLGRTPPGLRRKARKAYLPKVGFLLCPSVGHVRVMAPFPSASAARAVPLQGACGSGNRFAESSRRGDPGCRPNLAEGSHQGEHGCRGWGWQDFTDEGLTSEESTVF